MKILFISAFPPNSKTAGQKYSLELINELVKLHEVSLIYCSYKDHKTELDERVNVLRIIKPKKVCNSLRFFYIHPFFSNRINYDVLNLLMNIENNYDLLYFDFSQMFYYSAFLKSKRIVLMCHDIIFQKYFRGNIFEKLQLPVVYFYEKRILNKGNLAFVFSNKDKKILTDIYKVNAFVVNFYLKQIQIKEALVFEPNTFLFYGAWSRVENKKPLLEFVKKILPKIKNTISFDVIGDGLSDKEIKKITKTGRIRYHGFVSDPLFYLTKTEALIAYLSSGAGVKVKALDSLTVGTPVIGTNVTFEGIDIHDLPCHNIIKLPEIINLINNWISIDSKSRLTYSSLFQGRYEKNHFPEFLEKISTLNGTFSEKSECAN